VQADRSFGLNLAKSLLILWLLAILVVTIAIFASTFLSWPIAIVLTVLILLGRWGVVQLGDALTPGIGRQVVNDFGMKDAAQSEVVSRSVESLSQALRAFSSILPDINQFAVIEDIERGIWIPLSSIGAALLVLLMFGLPLVVLAYVIFRNKEVAP
jgi:ABC-type transport system involved in multi-copper enzyme maturation permease subunit